MPHIVIIDDGDIMAKNGKDLGNDLKFVDDLRKVIDFVNDENVHETSLTGTTDTPPGGL